MSDEEPTELELPADWKIPKEWADWAMAERRGWSLTHVKRSAKKFHEHHTLKRTIRNSVGEWELAFRYWIRRERDETPEKEQRTQGSLCAKNDCNALGSLSHSTTGGGPWYCSEHFLYNQNEGETPCLF